MLTGLLNNAYLRQQVMTRLTEKAPGNSVPILPIEAAVTGGRSYWGWKRSGFLEFQERLLEELVVAAVWLFGVKVTSKMMDRVIERMQKKGMLKALYTEADWSRDFMRNYLPGKKTPSILISPLERFCNSFEGLTKTMKVKALKWGVAVALPLFLCGYAIPRLNQLKTEWILKTFYGNQAPHPPGGADQSKPRQPVHPRTLPYAPDKYALPHPAWQTAGYSRPAPARGWPVFQGEQPAFAPGASQSLEPFGPHRADNTPQPSGLPANGKVRFGLSPVKAMSALSQMGHLVSNTHYGEVLVVDVGVTGGRMWTAWPRSPFESFEYGARDAGSLFFYLMSVPLIMNWGSKLLNTSWMQKLTARFFPDEVGTVIHMDEQVSHRINQLLAKEMAGYPLTTEGLKAMLYGQAPKGLSSEAMVNIRNVLGQQLRRTNFEQFRKTLQQEMLAYATNPADARQSRKVLARAGQYLENLVGKNKVLTADQLEQFLKAVWGGEIAGLTEAQQYHLNTAAKHAFHHHAGLTAGQMKAVIRQAANGVAADPQLSKRIGEATRAGGDRVIASMLRRSLNLAQLANSLDDRMLAQAEAVARCVERAVIEGAPVEQYVSGQLSQVVAEYREAVAAQGQNAAKNAFRKRVATYIQRIEEALARPGGKLNGQMLEELAQLLEQNGRTFPKGFRWMQGPGLGHLAKKVRYVAPLVDENRAIHGILRHRVEETMAQLASAISKHANQHQLVEQYRGMIGRLFNGEARFSMMLTRSDPHFKEQMAHQMNGLLRGGLTWGQKAYSMALRIVNRMPLEAESFFNPHEFKNIKHTVDKYFNLVEKRLGGFLAKNNRSVLGSTTELMTGVLEPLAKYNARWRYGVLGVAWVVSMLGVGWLIPKLQYWMTKALTGRDTHPGLSAVQQRMGVQGH